MSAIRLRIPLQQYSYIEYDFDGTPEEAINEVARQVAYYNSPKTVKTTPNLSPVEFLRTLHKYLVTNTLQMEDVDGLGTEKLYSQRDVVTWIRRVFDKIKRDN